MRVRSEIRRRFDARTNLLLIALHVLTLLVAAFSVYRWHETFPPSYRGWGEVTPDGAIAGWVVNNDAPTESVEIQLYVDNSFVSRAVANVLRPDVVAAGWSKHDECGYKINLPSLADGAHEARVFTVHKTEDGRLTLQLSGDPVRFFKQTSGGQVVYRKI